MCLYHNFASDHDSVFLSIWHILIHFEKLNIYGVIKINPFGREWYTLIHDRLFESDIKVYFNSKCYQKAPGKARTRFIPSLRKYQTFSVYFTRPKPLLRQPQTCQIRVLESSALNTRGNQTERPVFRYVQNRTTFYQHVSLSRSHHQPQSQKISP